MYKNLENVIYENHMSINSAASEAFKIRNLLFPKYDLYYLFESDENNTKSA